MQVIQRTATILVILLSVQAGQLTAQMQVGRSAGEAKFTIAGAVFTADRQPVIDATVVLLPGKDVKAPVLGSKTDQAGRFGFDDLGRGDYNIVIEKQGFIPSKDNRIAIGSGSDNEHLSFTLQRQSAIAGRITDETGQPLVGAMVRLEQKRYSKLGPVKVLVGQTSTNDLGEYRVFGVAPGQYYVSSFYRDTASVLGLRTRQVEAEGTVPEDFAVTYFPGTRTDTTAVPVTLAAGQTTTGIDIRQQLARSTLIVGTVQFADVPDGGGMMHVFLQPAETNGMGPQQAFALQNGNREFMFKSIPPGVYAIRAEANVKGQKWSARQEITVSESRVLRITLVPQAPFIVSGNVTTDSSEPLPEGLKLQLQGFYTRVSVAEEVKRDGHFQFSSSLPDDKYVVTISGDPSGSAYVKAVVVNDVPVSSRLVPLEQTLRALKVVVNTNGGRLEGTAVDASKSIVGSGTVVIAGSPKAGGDFDVYIAPVTNGSFRHGSLPPGVYRLGCVSGSGPSSDVSELAVKHTQSRGVELTLTAGQTTTAVVTCVPEHTLSSN